jgi:hypothetical protein
LISVAFEYCLLAGPTLSTRAGFTESRTVKVLFEETFYNAESKSFRVICLNAPLEGSFPKHCTDDTPAGGHSLHRSLAEQQNWLRQAVPRLLLPPSGASAVAVKAKTEFVESVVDSLLRQVAQFNASYVMVKAFYSHAADKLRGLIEKSLIAIVDQADPASVCTSILGFFLGFNAFILFMFWQWVPMRTSTVNCGWR